MKRFISLILIALLVCLPLTALATGPSAEPLYPGVDLSVWQGDVDFEALRGAGIQVVYLRAGYGSDYRDSTFERNYQAAKEAGLKVGAYYFVTARSVSQAQYQARAFLSLVAGKDLDCRLAMDFEDLTALSSAQVNQISLAFLEELERHGEPTLVYSDAYNASRVFSGAVTERPLWVAEYGVEEPSDGLNWSSWAGWQYTDRGSLPGISGRVDRDQFTPDVFRAGGAVPTPDVTPPQYTYTDYTVRRGDTLWAISRRYRTTVSALVSANRIANPNLIYPGQVLRIPVQDDRASSTYTVRRGDTLWAISRRYGTTVNTLVRLNHIDNPNLIYPGQVLLVP